MSGLAVGWYATTFGLAEATYFDPFPAGAINSTEFGSPVARLASPAVGLGAATQFGTPSSPRPVTTSAQGFARSGLGVPIGYSLATSAVPQIVGATGFQSVGLGAPRAALYALGIASGTQFGDTSALAVASAAGFAVGGVGLPSARMTARATGFRSASFGAPSINRAQPAQGFYRTRFGLPAAVRSDAYYARSFAPTTQFGRPKSRRNAGLPAEGAAPSTAFGEPAGMQQYDALHIPPGTRFGRAQRTRSTAC